MNCPKCNAAMEAGFLSDQVDRGTHGRGCWHPGAPEPKQARMLGIKLFESWVMEVDPDKLRPVIVYRCQDCGFLEAYAP